MAVAARDDQVDRVAAILSALEDAPTSAGIAAMCVISRDAEPRTVVGVHVDGHRAALSPSDVELMTCILTKERPFPGATMTATTLLSRLAQAELLTFRANAVRMLTPMGRG